MNETIRQESTTGEMRSAPRLAAGLWLSISWTSLSGPNAKVDVLRQVPPRENQEYGDIGERLFIAERGNGSKVSTSTYYGKKLSRYRTARISVTIGRPAGGIIHL